MITLLLHLLRLFPFLCGGRRCGQVKQERLAFLADTPFYTKRFAFYVGRRCRASPIRDVAKELGSTGTP